MLNCLKSDFYRMFKTKTLYILLAVLAGFSLFTIIISNIASGFVEEVTGEAMVITGKNLFINGLANNAVLFSAIFTSIYICSDFSSGMMKNYVAGNISRTKIFSSKLIVCMTAAFILLLANSILLGSIGSIVFGYGEFAAINISEYLVKFLLELLLLAAYVSVFIFIAFSMRSIGGVITINILITIFVSVLLSLLSNIPSLINIGDYWLDNNITAAISGFPDVLKEHLLRILLVGFIYIPIFLVPSYAIFITRDVR